MIYYIMSNTIDNINRIFNCSGNTGFYSAIPVTAYINNNASPFHSL